jgi:deoxyribonuclease-4
MMARIDDKDHIGLCLDSSHIFAAGYDIRTEKAYRETMEQLDQIVGIEHLFVIHLNDSKKPLGSRVDRHEHIGDGYIGPQAFEWLIRDPRLAGVPKIIETPKGNGKKDYDRINLDRLKSFLQRNPIGVNP